MENNESALVPYDAGLPTEIAPIAEYLGRIRPEWQATPLVKRVKLLLPVDTSSACQRLLNAAGHDLRSKIRILGIDLAKDVAQTFGLPRLENDEDLEEYSTSRLYDLAYRIGLLTRPEWRRLHRAYEIRRDLEHEDDEYEASVADLFYIFDTAIDVVLSREPVQVIHLRDISEVVESDAPIFVTQELMDDYRDAPPQRQDEIFHTVAFWCIDDDRPELVRSNGFRVIRKFASITPAKIKIGLAKKLELSIGRRPTDVATARVAIASGAFPFIHRRQQRMVVQAFLGGFQTIEPDWRQHPYHGELLDDFISAGGFGICPLGAERKIVRWMVEAYIGEPGRYGTFGRNRSVFYSDTAVPRIETILQDAPPIITGHITKVANESGIRNIIKIEEQQKRLERLVKLTSTSTSQPTT